MMKYEQDQERNNFLFKQQQISKQRNKKYNTLSVSNCISVEMVGSFSWGIGIWTIEDGHSLNFLYSESLTPEEVPSSNFFYKIFLRMATFD